MKILAVAVVASFFAGSHSVYAQQEHSRGTAVTRVATPLREAPDVEARALVTIPAKTNISTASCVHGWCAVQYEQFTGHAIQAFLRFPSAESLQSKASEPGRGYVNSLGQFVPSPTRTADGQPPSGASAQCRDGTFSFSRSRRGTCSHHGGVSRWL